MNRGLNPKQEAFCREYLIDMERFWSYVDKSNGDTSCWTWIGAKDSNGYGRFHIGISHNASRLSHRLAFGMTHGELPPVVRHRCDNPSCCNPAHLEAGTKADNNRDMMERGRHAAQKGTMRAARGENHGSAKLTSLAVDEIRSKYEAGSATQRSLAAEYSVCQRTINKIVRGIGWT